MSDFRHPGYQQIQLKKGDEATTDYLAVEEPMEMRVDGQPVAVVLRTPETNLEKDLDLAVGFLFTEGVIDDLDDIASLGHCTDGNNPNRQNLVFMNLASGNFRAKTRLQNAVRVQYVSSSCGVCGKASIDKVFQMTEPLPNLMTLDDVFISSVPAKLRSRQTNFEMTGGVHGAAIFTPDGQIKAFAEDVGRHNAVDKVIGRCLRIQEFPLDGHVLVVSSRAGFEIVQKAIMARIGAVVSVGAASSMAHDLANRSRLALYSFVRSGRFNDHSSL
ncbi:MAG: formate dehydrogenase accessory sulfurtransferase FdhD [Myxococcota bacterium]|nr:formate dehydrogenase accessory sulfurtransferase FdhD [Myxococcota bacterium]